MRLGVGARLIAGYCVLVVTLAAVGMFAASGISRMDSVYREYVLDYLGETRVKVHELDAQITKRMLAVNNYVQTLDSKYLTVAQTHLSDILDIIEKLDSQTQTEQGKAFCSKVKGLVKEFDRLVLAIIAHAKDDDRAALALDAHQSTEIQVRLDAAIQEWIEFTTALSHGARADAAKTAKRVRTVAIVVTVLAALLAAMTGIAQSRSISRPLGALTAVVESVAGGDLAVSVPPARRNDEIGKLALAFGMMVENLREIVKKALESADQVAGTSQEFSRASEEASGAIQQVSSSIQSIVGETTEQASSARQTSVVLAQLGNAIDQVAQGAQSQSRSLSEATGSVNGMVKAVERISSAARQVAAAAETAREAAQTGREAIEKTVGGMETISKTSEDTRSSISGLAGYSRRIVEIVEMISDISDQTNLLALNAAIEAARAGEHGRGFAVVADEVRKLADRSSKSAKEIADLILDMQKGTDASVKSVEAGAAAVDEGLNLASGARQALGEIVGAVENAGVEFDRIQEAIGDIMEASKQAMMSVDSSASVVEEATAATQEMAASSSEVLRSAESITVSVEKNAAAIEEVSSSAEEASSSISELANSAQSLTQTAEDLRTVVAVFRL